MSILSISRGLVATTAVLAALTSLPNGAAVPMAATPEGLQARTSRASDDATSTRRPRGIYAVVVLDESRSTSVADLDTLVNNPAVSGLAIRTFWSSLQPAKDRYDFSLLDTAFASATAAHKTVQLILVPGFGTPAWVLSEIPSCDAEASAGSTSGSSSGESRGGRAGGGAARGGRAGAARGGRAGAGRSGREGAASGSSSSGGHEQAATDGAARCGKASFVVSEGAAHGDQQELPLPWNPAYKAYWKTFLTAVAARYGTRDAFVSIAVGGPTAESVEIILPRSGDQLERWGELLEIFYRDASYHRSDKAFVDEWNTAVTTYADVFRNLTIVLTRGSGLLDFTRGQGNAAQASIASSFASHVVGSNAKATQTSGMKACRETVAGIKGVKEMAASGSYAPPILGGAQFNTSFSQKPAAEGCRASCDAEAPVCQSVTPAQSLANVLSVYFDGTPVGDAYGASKGTARMNYLQVYEKDILFAGTQPAVQAMLEQASHRILMQAR